MSVEVGNTVDEQLTTIISAKTFDQTTLDWKELLKKIPIKIQQILKDTYNADKSTEIQDPLSEIHNETIESFTDKIIEHITQSFSKHPPFTILRLAEVLQDPAKYHSTSLKFLRAIETITCVSSTQHEFDDDKANENIPKPSTSEPAESSTATTENSGTPALLIGSVEPQTILLSKIDWLTEEDIDEIESENYLVEEFPVNEPSATFEGSNGEDEYPLENESLRKRKNEGEDTETEKSGDSPEKRFKSGTEKQEDVPAATEENQEPKEREVGDVGDVSDISVDEADTSIGNTTLEEDKMDIDS